MNRAELLERIETLERRVAAIADSPWVSAAELSRLINLDRHRITKEITQAELDAACGRQPKYKRGEHYFNAAASDSRKPSWRVHKDRFLEAFSKS